MLFLPSLQPPPNTHSLFLEKLFVYEMLPSEGKTVVRKKVGVSLLFRRTSL